MLITNYKTRKAHLHSHHPQNLKPHIIIKFCTSDYLQLCIKSVFPNMPSMEKPTKQFVTSQGTPTYENIYKPEKGNRSRKIQSLLNYHQEIVVSCCVCVCVTERERERERERAYILTEIEVFFPFFEEYFKFFEVLQNFKILMHLFYNFSQNSRWKTLQQIPVYFYMKLFLSLS